MSGNSGNEIKKELTEKASPYSSITLKGTQEQKFSAERSSFNSPLSRRSLHHQGNFRGRSRASSTIISPLRSNYSANGPSLPDYEFAPETELTIQIRALQNKINKFDLRNLQNEINIKEEFTNKTSELHNKVVKIINEVSKSTSNNNNKTEANLNPLIPIIKQLHELRSHTINLLETNQSPEVFELLELIDNFNIHIREMMKTDLNEAKTWGTIKKREHDVDQSSPPTHGAPLIKSATC